MPSERDIDKTVGLCSVCKHVKRVPTEKGSVFYMCRLSAVDPRFVKYPRLPVLSCPGHERDERDND